jgi:hypothetical protein
MMNGRRTAMLDRYCRGNSWQCGLLILDASHQLRHLSGIVASNIEGDAYEDDDPKRYFGAYIQGFEGQVYIGEAMDPLYTYYVLGTIDGDRVLKGVSTLPTFLYVYASSQHRLANLGQAEPLSFRQALDLWDHDPELLRRVVRAVRPGTVSAVREATKFLEALQAGAQVPEPERPTIWAHLEGGF